VSLFRREPEVVLTTVEEDDEPDDRAVAVIIYLALILGLLLLWLISLARRGDEVVVEAEPEPTTSSVTVPAAAPPPPAQPETARLTIDGQPVFPLSEHAGRGGDLSRFEGGRAVAVSVPVQSVDADEGFWIGEDTTNRVWVQLVNVAAESAYKVEDPDFVSFVGTVVPTPSDFPEEVGVTPEEGARQMRDQRQHIQVEGIALELYD
jgi:hypothetical protein